MGKWHTKTRMDLWEIKEPFTTKLHSKFKGDYLMMEIKLLIKKYFKHFLVLAGLCLVIWVYIYSVHGYTKYRYYDNGQIRTVIPYKGGKQHGAKKSYYENGQLVSEISYANGKKHGVGKSYYENGRLHYEIPYVNDEIHGIEKEYDENGQLHYETTYVNGKKHGVQKVYDKNGKLQEERTYINDERQGSWVEKVYENGQLVSEIPYVNDKIHGVQKWYYENGKLKWKKPYKEGRRYGYGGYYDDKGKPAMPFYKPSSTKFDRYHFRTDLSRIFVAGYIWGENL